MRNHGGTRTRNPQVKAVGQAAIHKNHSILWMFWIAVSSLAAVLKTPDSHLGGLVTMSALKGGAQLVDAQVALGQTRRAREDERGQERAAVSLDDDAVVRVLHLDVVAGHRRLFCCSPFFTLSFSMFLLGRKDACARVARVSGCSPLVLGDFVSGARRAFVTGCI